MHAGMECRCGARTCRGVLTFGQYRLARVHARGVLSLSLPCSLLVGQFEMGCLLEDPNTHCR